MNHSIKLGSSFSGKDLFWTAGMNFHCYTSGISGCGKSNFLKNMILQLPQAGTRVIIFDYTSDFHPCLAHFAPIKGFSYEALDVRLQVGLNPFQRLQVMESGEVESTYVAAARIADAIIATYHIRGDIQRVNLRRSVMDYMESGISNLSFPGLVDQIEEDEKQARKMASALLCLKDISELLPSRHESFKWNLCNPGVTLISFTSLQNESTQSLAIQLLLFELWSLKVQTEKDSCPVVVVCDECQRLDFSNGSINVRLLREGRKHHLFGWYASQFITNDIAMNALDQVGLRAYFYPGARQVKHLAKMVASDEKESKVCADLIRALEPGQFIYQDTNGRPIVCYVPNVSDFGNIIE